MRPLPPSLRVGAGQFCPIVLSVRAYLRGPLPIAFAHRGGAKLWPENTLTAFAGALGLGYRWIETDVHLTRDAEVVIFHDFRLERTTDGVGWLRDRTLAELRELDAGFTFRAGDGSRPFRGAGIRIPTLEEAMDLEPALRLNLEMKPRDPRLARALRDRIDAHGWHDRVLVACAHAPLTRYFRAITHGRVATSAGWADALTFWTAVRTGTWRWVPIEYDALQVPPRWRGLEVVTPAFIHAAHARGIHVHVWTVDDPAEMSRLRALGADGLMTDRPDLLLPG